MNWWEQTFLTLDTETTSADPEQALTASICTAVVNPAARSTQVRGALVAVEMPDEASKVNGLTTGRLMAEGKPPADVLDDYCGELAASLLLRVPLIIMNAPYDLTVLDRDCRRHGVPTISDRLDGQPIAPIVDPGVLDKHVVKYRRRVSPTQGARCLKTLAQVHGVGWDDDMAHTAEYDALQAGRVVWQLMRRFPALGRLPLAELHARQVRWYQDQAEGLAQYFRREANQRDHDAGKAHGDAERETARGDARELRAKADGVTVDWPIRPFGGAA